MRLVLIIGKDRQIFFVLHLQFLVNNLTLNVDPTDYDTLCEKVCEPAFWEYN